MAFNHTEYAHRTGRRSRPRGEAAMDRLCEDLDNAVANARLVRKRHARKDLRGRHGELATAIARLEAAMVPARQEAARNGKDSQRRERYGADLRRRTAAVRYERLRLKKMIGDWK